MSGSLHCWFWTNESIHHPLLLQILQETFARAGDRDDEGYFGIISEDIIDMELSVDRSHVMASASQFMNDKLSTLGETARMLLWGISDIEVTPSAKYKLPIFCALGLPHRDGRVIFPILICEDPLNTFLVQKIPSHQPPRPDIVEIGAYMRLCLGLGIKHGLLPPPTTGPH